MIHILFVLLVLAIVAGLVFYLVRTLPLPAPWNVVVQVIAVLIVLLVLFDMLLGGGLTGLALLHAR